MSLEKHCENGMEAHLTKKEIIIIGKEKKVEVMRGNRDHANEMQRLNINDRAASTNNINKKKLMHSVYELKKQKDTTDYLSQAMWNPVPDTWIKTIKAGFFATWLGLIDHLVKNTTQEHQRQRKET